MTEKQAIKIIIEAFKQKELLNYGMYKKVFPLKSNPNYIVKAFNKKSQSTINAIKKEEEFFNKYPDISAKIIRINYEKGWMIQEKLDTINFLKDLNSSFSELKDILEKEIRNFAVYEKMETLETCYFRQVHIFHVNPFLEKIYYFFEKLEDYDLVKVNSISSRFYFALDLSGDNLGYDKDKNIKFLDM